MANISTKGRYGLTAMVILAKKNNSELMQIKDIATEGNIPQNYLEQILVLLKKNNLVESIRGANGGYRLSKDKNDIIVFEILNSLECCMEHTDSKNKNDILEPFWKDTKNKIKGIFSISLGDLEEFLQSNSQNFTYII